MKSTAYKKLLITLCLSLIVMYGVMFLNVDDTNHIYLSLTRFYMSILMICPMAILMLLMMPQMFMDKRRNVLIHIVSSVVFIISLILLRTQTPITDEQYMRAMIPHHSSAILTSKQATIRDPEVKKLSLGIIQSQGKEIKEMKELLRKLK